MKKLLRIALLMTVLASLLVIASPAGAVPPDELSGVITDPWGNPLPAGATVDLIDANTGAIVATTISGAGGAYGFDFDLLGIPDGVYSVAVTWQGSDPYIDPAFPVAASIAAPAVVPIAFPAAATMLSGNVTDALGVGVNGVMVEIVETGHWATTYTSGAAGDYFIYAPTAAAAAPFTVRASLPGYLTQVVPNVAYPALQDFTLANGNPLLCADLSGTVTDAVTGAPIAGATVTVTGMGAGGIPEVTQATTTDTFGIYSFDLTGFAWPQNLTVSVSAAGYTTQTVTWNFPGACTAPGPGPILDFELESAPPPKVSWPIQLPIIRDDDCWETWIQIQNVGDQETKAIVFFWGQSEQCEPNCDGPILVECTGLIKPGAAATIKLKDKFGVAGPKSAIVYSVLPSKAQEKCQEAAAAVGDHFAWKEWKEQWEEEAMGTRIAVTVQRTQTTPGADEDYRSSVYKGISDEAEFGPDLRTGTYMYYTPLIFHDGGGYGWNSDLWVQNSGQECTSVEVWYHSTCEEWEIVQVPTLPPGETALVPKPSWTGLGSAWIRSEEPLGIVVDHQNAAKSQLLTYTGFSVHYGAMDLAGPGDWENYGPLIYREYNGWDAGVQVQNLSSETNALVKVYFLDNSGDIITTLVDWICKRCSQTFYLPAINNLPGNYVGQFRVHSQNWWSPGDLLVEAPKVLSVVNLINYNTGQGLSYNALPAWQAWDETEPFTPGVVQIALPFLVKKKHDPFEPTGSTWTSKIALTNLVHYSSLNDVVVRIDFFDQNGYITSVCQKLDPKDVDYIDLDNYGILPPGWLGSAMITVECTRPWFPEAMAIGAVVVNEATDYPSGDLSTGYEAFPIPDPNLTYWLDPNRFPTCPECR